LFPTKIRSEKIYADGHFYVVPRKVKLPNGENWVQKPLPMNHQKDFVSISTNSRTFAVLNKGLPEYEAKINGDGTITFAITLLRCVEWLSRDDFASRMSHAGPGLRTPEAQCLGKKSFEISIVTSSESNWLDSDIHVRGKEFNNPFKPIFPTMAQTPFRLSDKVVLKPTGFISQYLISHNKQLKSFLPPIFSFLEINNNKLALSALKKAEKGNFFIVRLYNLSSKEQEATLKFYESILIKNAEIVNFLEEKPINQIKAKIKNFDKNYLKIALDPYVIATFKIEHNII
jgi:alpha-mannosidase